MRTWWSMWEKWTRVSWPRRGRGCGLRPVRAHHSPGLINCHVHLDLMLPYRGLGNSFDEFGIPYRTLLSYRRAAEALDCGVTTIRSAAIPDDIDIGLKKAINKNMLCGPNTLPAERDWWPTMDTAQRKTPWSCAAVLDAL